MAVAMEAWGEGEVVEDADEHTVLNITSPLSWVVEPREVEACGVGFFEQLRVVHGAEGDAEEDEKRKKRARVQAGQEGADAEDEEETFRFPDHPLEEEDIEDMDYYELLGLGHLAMRVDADLLKRAYRKALLLYHPDKTGRGDQDAVFIAVQKAYETLSDDRKRRAYDSELDFEDDIPTGREKGDFFEIYRPVFERNARFAVKRPVPHIGDNETSIDDVYRFYDYWSRFESWRDFSLKAAEHDLEEAGSREEKRWMQKENDKRARVLKKEEYKRLATLVDRARSLDPRILRAMSEQKRRKEEVKQKRVEEKRRREEEARRAEEEEKARRDEEERRAKQEREKAKAAKEAFRKQQRAVRVKFRTQCQASRARQGPQLTQEDEDLLVEALDLDTLNALAEALGGDEVLNDAGVLEALSVVERERSAAEKRRKDEEEQAKAAAAEREKQLQAQQSAKQAANPWSEPELSMLAKAVVRFPAGTQKRWQHIANFINQQLRLAVLRSKEECIKEYQTIQSAPQKPGDVKAAPVTAAAAGAGAKGESAGGEAGSARVVKVDASTSEDDVWTQEQQKQLEAGLTAHPATMDKNERWRLIAAGVDGKNKKQCIERYKTLRAALQQKKK